MYSAAQGEVAGSAAQVLAERRPALPAADAAVLAIAWLPAAANFAAILALGEQRQARQPQVLDANAKPLQLQVPQAPAEVIFCKLDCFAVPTLVILLPIYNAAQIQHAAMRVRETGSNRLELLIATSCAASAPVCLEAESAGVDEQQLPGFAVARQHATEVA